MSSLFYFFIFVFFFTTSFAQNPASDTATLYSVSKNLLQKEISFVHSGGKLADVLKDLSRESGISFSYSEDKVKSVSVGSINVKDKSLHSTLNTLLSNSGFTYMLVGRVVFLVEEEAKAEAEEFKREANASERPFLEKYEKHIYTPKQSNFKLSPEQKKILRRHYREELRWASKYGSNKEVVGDTLKIPKNNLPVYSLASNKYYVGGTLNLGFYNTRIVSNYKFNWQREMGYEANTTTSIIPGITAGFRYNNWVFSTGIVYQKVRLNETWTEERRSGPPSHTPAAVDRSKELVKYLSNQEHLIISSPFDALYLKRYRNFYGGIGAGLQMCFVNTVTRGTANFINHYSSVSSIGLNESYSTFMLSANLETKIGYLVQERLMLFSGIGYGKAINPLYRNFLYSYKPDLLMLKFSCIYFIK
ncbi:MAG: STN domain-containing protein [Cytophagaceae bacterium]